MRVTTVLFDLNNTLEKFDPRAHAIRSACIEVMQEQLGLAYGVAERAVKDARMRLTSFVGEYPVEHHYVFWVEAFRAARGAQPDDVTLDELYRGYITHYLKHLDMFPDARPALDEVMRMGLRVGVVANGHSIRVRAFLRRYALFERLVAVVASGDFMFRKPDVAIFEQALLQAGVLPLQCVMVGDTLENDTAGANLAGLWTIHLDRDRAGIARTTTSRWEEPDDVVHALNEVPNSWVFPVDLDLRVAVVMAGGTGRRMHPLTARTQKCLLPVRGEPVLHRTIRQLLRAGVGEVLVLAQHKSGELEASVKGLDYGPQVNVVRVTGASTAESLAQVRHMLKGDVIYVHGDIIVAQGDLHRLVKTYYAYKRTEETNACLAVAPKDGDLTHALLSSDGEHRVRILHGVEWRRESRPDVSDAANCLSLGLAIFESSSLDWSATQRADGLMVEALLEGPANRGRVRSVRVDAFGHLETVADYDRWKDADPERELC